MLWWWLRYSDRFVVKDRLWWCVVDKNNYAKTLKAKIIKYYKIWKIILMYPAVWDFQPYRHSE